MDLFLIWLLYRFMKSKKVISDEKAEVSTLLFAHDSKAAKKLMLNWYTGEDDRR